MVVSNQKYSTFAGLFPIDMGIYRCHQYEKAQALIRPALRRVLESNLARLAASCEVVLLLCPGFRREGLL